MSELPDFQSRFEAGFAAKAAEAAEASKARTELEAIERQRLEEEGQFSPELAAEIHAFRTAEAIKLDRDRLRKGTTPEEVWGEDAGKLCRDFIAIAREYGFPNSALLRAQPSPARYSHEYSLLAPEVYMPGEASDEAFDEIERYEHDILPELLQKWHIRGYGVGGYIFQLPRRLPRLRAGTGDNGHWQGAGQQETVWSRLTDLPHNVFLCEDGLLRTYTSTTVIINGSRPGVMIGRSGSENDAPESQDVKPEIAALPPEEIADLPIDVQANTYNPSIGRFVILHTPPNRQQVMRRKSYPNPNVSRKSDNDDFFFSPPLILVPVDVDVGSKPYVRFEEQDLEEILLGYAQAAA